MVLPGGVGPQLVRPFGQRPPIREVHPRQHQLEILGNAAQKLVDEENVALLPPWADPQHLGCSTTGKPTRSFATERVSLDSV